MMMRIGRKLRFLLAAASLCTATVCSGQAWGEERYVTVDSAAPQEIVGGMSNKLARGIANTAGGWLELPTQIYDTYRNEGALKGIFVGPLKGVGMTLVRTATGLGETFTFFLAYPGFYDPWLDPPYPVKTR